jgi:signal transduction histidine kinase
MSDDDTARLEALLAEQQALRRVALLVAADTPAGELFDRVCEEVGLLLGVQSSDIVRYEEEGWATIVGAWVGSGNVSFPVGERIPVEGGTVTARIYRTECPARVDDYVGHEGEFVQRMLGYGIRSVVGAPVQVGGRLWGGIMVTSSEPDAFPPDTERRICDFAELVTAALANADSRAQLAASRARIVTAADEARRRIERDLHDGAQQRLVSLALSLRLLHSHLEEGSEAARELESARAELDLALGELRELARGIHPSVLTDRGLEAALSGLVARSPVPVELDVAAAADLPQCLQTTAYFVVAEGLTNAIKHAGCTRAEVLIERNGDEVLIEVRDDGVGGTVPHAGSGLRGLDDRVSALGGDLEIESPPGDGTILRVRAAVGESQRLAGVGA